MPEKLLNKKASGSEKLSGLQDNLEVTHSLANNNIACQTSHGGHETIPLALGRLLPKRGGDSGIIQGSPQTFLSHLGEAESWHHLEAALSAVHPLSLRQ